MTYSQNDLELLKLEYETCNGNWMFWDRIQFYIIIPFIIMIPTINYFFIGTDFHWICLLFINTFIIWIIIYFHKTYEMLKKVEENRLLQLEEITQCKNNYDGIKRYTEGQSYYMKLKFWYRGHKRFTIGNVLFIIGFTLFFYTIFAGIFLIFDYYKINILVVSLHE